jgi:colanic acid/amylovoran biosynthesis glycosyltransferase
MHIQIFVEWYPSSYKSYFDTQFAQFVQDGHDVTIFSLGTMGSNDNPKISAFGLHSKVRHYPGSLRDLPRHAMPLADRVLRRPAQAYRVFRGGKGGKLRARVMDVARVLLLPENPPDICLIHNLSTAVQMRLLRARYPNTPIALYYHGGEVPRWTNPISGDRARMAFEMADVVLTNTEWSRAQIIGRGCEPGKAVVLPMGFDLNDFIPPEPRTYRDDGKLRLVSAGRLSEEKGLDHAIDAIGMLEPEEQRLIEYTIVGDGYCRDDLERMAHARGLAALVRFTGTRSPKETILQMAEADALLLPSVPVGNCLETQACVVQEALLMKTPVVTTRIGGVPESIPLNMQHLTCDCGDSAALKNVIRGLMLMEPSALHELGHAGREWAMQRYDIRVLNKRLIDTVLSFRDSSPASGTLNESTQRSRCGAEQIGTD